MSRAIVQKSFDLFHSIFSDPKHVPWICLLLLAFDAILTSLIIWKIPYTEIDFLAYKEQVSQYRSGERDYYRITSSTGPLVYPALHVYLYSVLEEVVEWKGFAQLGITGEVKRMQALFGALYIVSLAVVMVCYRNVNLGDRNGRKVPPWLYFLLTLSKRLHSIYVLRLFNDCFVVLGLWTMIYLLQRRQFTLATIAFSLGLGVKMSLLLILPAFGVLLFLAHGTVKAISLAGLIVIIQALIGWEFLHVKTNSYMGRAFELGRVFTYKWTVNWRFIDEETFLSRKFAIMLIIGHILTIIVFIERRWLRAAGLQLADVVQALGKPFGPMKQRVVAQSVTPDLVMTSVLTANAIGMLFARSLHYQFFSWLSWTTPYLLWRAKLHPILVVGIYFAQEIAWNVYPSTSLSSITVVSCLALQVIAIYLATAPKTQGDAKINHSHVE